MNQKSVDLKVSLNDSTLLSFKYDDNKQTMEINIFLWNEKKMNVYFEKVLYMLYQPGDYLEGLYENILSPILKDVMLREFKTIPVEHNYKLYSLLDIDGFAIVQLVAEKIYFFIDEP